MSYLSKKASALLITILMLALVSAVVLVTSRGVIISTRLNSSTGASDMAEQMAENGVQEGLAWYKNNPQVEYGNLNNQMNSSLTPSYSLTSIFRGFNPTNNSSGCLSVSGAGTDTSGIDTNCPYYSLVVRNNVLLSANTIENYNLLQLPVGKAVSLNFIPDNISIQLESGIGLNNGTLNFTCNNNVNFSLNSSNPFTNLPSTCQSPLSVTFNTTSPPSTQSTVLTIFNPSSIKFLISKGYTTIESTGYAGGIISKRIVSIYPNWNPLNAGTLPYIVDQTTTKTLNSDGL